MSNTICIITQSHLCRNPRVLKEAQTLACAGYKVQILTGIISTGLYQQDLSAIKQIPNISLGVISDLSRNSIEAFRDKFLKKAGGILQRLFKIETSLSLGYGSISYYKAAKGLNAELYICHQELATYIGTKLLNHGFKVAFDFEDWYSEDLLPAARAERPIRLLKKIESIALNKGIFCLTTSFALSKKLSMVYACPQPQVLYNVFPSPSLVVKTEYFLKPLKLFWFSQTIGSGRGLEQFITLLNSVKNKLELHLLGNVSPDYRKNLQSLFPQQHQLFFHDTVEPGELAGKIASFDIGLALELVEPMNRDYTITNKYFQYLQSGLPVIVSETKGQNEVFDTFKPGFKLTQQPTAKEATELESWLNNPVALQAAREQAIKAAQVYNWEQEAIKLIDQVRNAIGK